VKTVLLMRHAMAGEGLPSQRDFDRELTSEGQATATQTGHLLKRLGVRIDVVLASAAARTRQTADAVREIVCPEARLELLDSLYHAPAESYAHAARRLTLETDSTVLIVGHNPGIADLICRWSDESLSVPTATVAIFESNADVWTRLRKSHGDSLSLSCLIQDARIVRSTEAFSETGESRSH
jgi:phosphohistidine phosphatase